MKDKVPKYIFILQKHLQNKMLDIILLSVWVREITCESFSEGVELKSDGEWKRMVVALIRLLYSLKGLFRKQP